jgi:hypothetical protein
VVRETLTAPPFQPPLYLTKTDSLHRLGLAGRMGCGLGHSFEHGLSHERMRAGPDSGSRPEFNKGNRPTTVSAILFHLVCSLNLV